MFKIAISSYKWIYSLLLSLLSLLFLWVGIDHKELAVGRIPLLLKQLSWFGFSEILMFFRHKNGTFKCFHCRDVDVVLIFLIPLQVGLS